MPDQPAVLLVEDDEEILCAACLRLRAAGFRTLTAGDGEAGVAAAVANRPNAILLDVRLPRRDGLSVLSELKHKAETKDIPVVMLSASVVDQEAALDAGARFFLRKPYRGDMLVQAVWTALGTNDSRCIAGDTKPTGTNCHELPSGFDLGL